MIEKEQQRAENDHRKLQIEVERLNLENGNSKENLKSAVETKQDMKHHTVKLPKLDFKKFSMGLFKWQEFYHSFNTDVHSNQSFSPVVKVDYPRAKFPNRSPRDKQHTQFVFWHREEFTVKKNWQ